jgi:hypothetical protein
LEVKQVFEQLAQAEKGGVTPEQRKKLEEQAAEKVRGFFGSSMFYVTFSHDAHINRGCKRFSRYATRHDIPRCTDLLACACARVLFRFVLGG